MILRPFQLGSFNKLNNKIESLLAKKKERKNKLNNKLNTYILLADYYTRLIFFDFIFIGICCDMDTGYSYIYQLYMINYYFSIIYLNKIVT